MTTHLYCRECGWSYACRGRRAARRAAARHHCATAQHAPTSPWWWVHFWTRLRVRRQIDGSQSGSTASAGGVLAFNARTQAVVLTAHHAEITRRSRQAIVELVRAGYQIGPPPYGYHALRIRVIDAAGHAQFRIVLVPDWRTARVVTRIFSWRADEGLGFAAIARRLNTDHLSYPTPSRTGRWTADAVRRIVTNPKYTGRQVWARTVGGRPVPVAQWVTSAPMVHEPLVDERIFRRAQAGAITRDDSAGAA